MFLEFFLFDTDFAIHTIRNTDFHEANSKLNKKKSFKKNLVVYDLEKIVSHKILKDPQTNHNHTASNLDFDAC